MAVELTSEQAERIERVIRAVTRPSMSVDAVNEMRAQMIWNMTHPVSPDEVHEFFEYLRNQLGPTPENSPSADELLGYDEYGLPT